MNDRSKNLAKSLLNEIEDKSDRGSFHIENKEGRAILTVYPPENPGGESVGFDEVRNRLRLLRVEDVDFDKIDKVVLHGDGKPHDIGRWSGGKAVDAEIAVTVSSDKMRAFIRLKAPQNGGKDLDFNQILRALEANGVKFGINEDKIKQIAEKPVYSDEISVARGVLPKNGKNGSIRLYFDRIPKGELKENEYGRVDYKEIKLVQSVPEGSILAELLSPESGFDGKNVLGEILPAHDGREVQWRLGSNVHLSEDGQKAIASITGRPVYDQHDILRVDETIRLEQVDYSTGNIDFPGTIIVGEKIADGFKLDVAGSIIVEKSFGKAFLKAKGDIILNGGFMGHDEGSIDSGGDIYARFVERGRLHASGSIYIKDASMHAELIAGDSIWIKGGRGELIGGKAVAGRNIICHKLGAVVETKTHLVVGSPPELIDELQKIQDEITEKEEILQKVLHTKKNLEEAMKKRTLDDEEWDMLNKLRGLHTKFTNSLDSLQNQFEFAVNSFEPGEDSYVAVLDEIYHGVEIMFGKNRIFRSGLQTVTGKNFMYVNTDREVVQKSSPPGSSDSENADPENRNISVPGAAEVIEKSKKRD